MGKVVKVIGSILLIVVIVGAIACVGVMSDGFKNWDKFGNKASADVKGGTLVSEKYGTYEIPEQNMFFSLNAQNGIVIENGTDFTYFFDEYMDSIAKVNKIDAEHFKAENQMLLRSEYPLGDVAENLIDFVSRENYPYKNLVPYYDGSSRSNVNFFLMNNKFEYDAEKYMDFVGYYGTYPILDVGYASKADLNKAADKIVTGLKRLTYDEVTYSAIAVRCLSRKVTVQIEGQEDITSFLPVMIISDKGYPMTEKIYNEIIAEQK